MAYSCECISWLLAAGKNDFDLVFRFQNDACEVEEARWGLYVDGRVLVRLATVFVLLLWVMPELPLFPLQPSSGIRTINRQVAVSPQGRHFFLWQPQGGLSVLQGAISSGLHYCHAAWVLRWDFSYAIEAPVNEKAAVRSGVGTSPPAPSLIDR